jgi:uncharacterized phage protein (TIGR01671 family)
MRRIKFRVYNKKTKSWIHGPHEDNSLDGCNILGEMILCGEFLNGVSIEDLNEIEILQYTGLKDSNGKDIFEGDILKVGYYTGYVKYLDANACYILAHPKYKAYRFDLYLNKTKDCLIDTSNLEVIGNIFDNPKLLK